MLYAHSFKAVHLNAMQRTRRAYKGETGKVLLFSSTCCSLPRQQLFQPIDIVATRLRLVAPPPLNYPKNPPRPQVRVPAPAGPKRATHDKDTTVRKRFKGQRTGETGAGSSLAGTETGGLVESEGQVIWDEDEVMLFFWGNSKAAKQRHLKKVGENTQRLEQWRDSVAQVSI